MLKVASGRPNSFAFLDMSSNSCVSALNHLAMIRAISAGSSQYAPTPFSKTNETLPSSWHGMHPEQRQAQG